MKSVVRASVVMTLCVVAASCASSTDTGIDSSSAVPPSQARARAIDEALVGLTFDGDLGAIAPSHAGEAGQLSELELQAVLDEAEALLDRVSTTSAAPGCTSPRTSTSPTPTTSARPGPTPLR